MFLCQPLFQSVFLESVIFGKYFFRDYSRVAFFLLCNFLVIFFFKILVCVPDIHTFHCPAFAGTLSGRKKGFLRIHKRQQSLDWVFKVSMMNCCDDKSCLIRKVIKIFVWLALPEVSIHPW